MSEQQGIISGLRELLAKRSPATEHPASSMAFEVLVERLKNVQDDQRKLLAWQSVGAAEQRLLVKQTKTMMDLLAQLTDDQERRRVPEPVHVGATSSAPGGNAADFAADFENAFGGSGGDGSGDGSSSSTSSGQRPPPPPPTLPPPPPPQESYRPNYPQPPQQQQRQQQRPPSPQLLIDFS
jgi:hypothetical protein